MGPAGKPIDALFEDPVIPSQLWCCISFLSPETVRNTNIRGVKVRGVYATRPEAEKQAHHLQSLDPDFHIFVGEVGKWLTWDPDPNSIEDQQYKEKELQELATEYKKNREKAKIMEQERKREIMEDSVRKEAGKVSKQKERLQKKLADIKTEKKLSEIEDERRGVSTQSDASTPSTQGSRTDTYLKNEAERLAENEKKIKEKTENLKSVDDKINHLQKMYKEMSAKKSAN